MNLILLLVLILHFLLTFAQNNPDHYSRFCYVAAWSKNRHGPAAFHPEDIDASVCTHLCLAFVRLDATGTQLEPIHQSEGPALYKRFNAVKVGHPHLKTLLSVGGWGMGSTQFSILVHNDSNINSFANNAVKFLRDNGFDGLDVDWEYPAAKGSPPSDKERFTKLIQTLSTVFHVEGRSTSRNPLLLTAALSSGKSRASHSYEAVELAGYLDFINLMTYSLHGLWGKPLVTGHHSPLFGSTSDPYHNIDYLARYWASTGVPKHKILIGAAFYGNTFSLNNTAVTDVGSAAYGPGRPGPYTRDPGVLAYYEVCELVKNGTETHRSVNQSVPYLVDNERWVGYDDEKSLQEKVKYVIDNGFGGIMVWTLDMDDFKGICGKTYPLIHAVKDAFHSLVGKRQLMNYTPVIFQGNAVVPTIKFDGGSSVNFQPNFCSNKADGLYADPSSCQFYYDCAFGQTIREPCPFGTVFHNAIHVCDYPLPGGTCNYLLG